MKHISCISLCLLVTGCSYNGSMSTQMRNPMHVGRIDQNRVVVTEASMESRYDLPAHSLDRDASLVKLDGTTACFEIQVRHLDPPKDSGPPVWPDLQRAQYVLHATGNKTVTVLAPTLTVGPPTQQQFMGEIPAGVNDDFGTDAQLTVLASTANVCFQHNGKISSKTASIELLVTYKHELSFVWKF